METDFRQYSAFDVETTGFNPHKGAKIFSFCICDCYGNTGVYRMDYEKQTRNERNWHFLREYFQNTRIFKVAHNFKFELSFLIQAGIDVPVDTVWHDTMIMSQMLHNLGQSHALDFLAWELGGFDRDLDKKVQILSKSYGGSYQNIPEKVMNKYQISDGQRTMALFQLFSPQFMHNKVLYEDYLNEIQLIKATERMERYGIQFDQKKAESMVEFMENELDGVQNACYTQFGEYLNMNSEKQMRKILYGTLKLPVLKYTETGVPATDKETLSELQKKHDHPVFDMIFKSRSYTKGIGMMKNYIKYADDKSIIHPKINTNLARTGRESSSEPNLQNVSKEAVLHTAYAIPAREVFWTKPRHILLFVDYAGIEMRLIVDSANEQSLIEALHSGKDLHAIAAECFYGEEFKNCADPKHKKLLRSNAKNTSFAVAYGAGLVQVTSMLQMPLEKAKESLSRYCSQFPRVSQFTQSMIQQVKNHGYVITPFGRKLDVPMDKQYSGSNYMIQGTAAGILKRAQVRVDKFLSKRFPDIRIVLPIHDELVISMPRKHLKNMKMILNKIDHIMTTFTEIKVPLETEWKYSVSSWNQAKEFKK